MNFYSKNGELIQDIQGLMLQANAKALGFQCAHVPKLMHPALSTGPANARSEIVEHLGRGIIRSTIKDSEQGIVANCFVTQGIMK